MALFRVYPPSSRACRHARSALAHGKRLRNQGGGPGTRSPSNVLLRASRLHRATRTSVVAAVGLRYIEGDTP